MADKYKEHYETLGLKPDATSAEIKRAYRVLATRHHPDKNENKSAEEKTDHENRMKAANNAYDGLKAEITRKASAEKNARARAKPNAGAGDKPGAGAKPNAGAGAKSESKEDKGKSSSTPSEEDIAEAEREARFKKAKANSAKADFKRQQAEAAAEDLRSGSSRGQGPRAEQENTGPIPGDEDHTTSSAGTENHAGASAGAAPNEGDENTTGPAGAEYTPPPPPPGGDRTPEGPLPKQNNDSNMLPNPKHTWAHTFARHNPKWSVQRGVGNFFSRSIEDHSKFLPHWLARGTFGMPDYIKPYIRAVERSVDETKLVDPVRTFNEALNDIAYNIPIDPHSGTQKAVLAAKGFIDANRAELEQLDASLYLIQTEAKLESDLTALLKKTDTADISIPLKQHKIEKFNRLVDRFEEQTGRVFHDKDKRLKSVLNGGLREFYLRPTQAQAMIDHARMLRSSLHTVLEPDFLSTYEASIQKASTSKNAEDLTHSVQRPFSDISKEITDAQMRFENRDNILVPRIAQWGQNIDPAETSPSHKVNAPYIWPQGTNAPRQSIFDLEVALRFGYVNPHERTHPIVVPDDPNNAEKILMELTDLDLDDASVAPRINGIETALYEYGLEHLFLEGLAILVAQEGKKGKSAALTEYFAILGRPMAPHKYLPHYKHYIKSIFEQAPEPHSPEIQGHRDTLRKAALLIKHIQYDFKFAGQNWIATPGRVGHYDPVKSYFKTKMFNYATGRTNKMVLKQVDDDDNIISNSTGAEGEKTKLVDESVWLEAKGTNFRYLKMLGRLAVVPLAPIRIGYDASMFVAKFSDYKIPKLIGKSALAGLALHGAVAATEYGMEENNPGILSTNSQSQLHVAGYKIPKVGAGIINGSLGAAEILAVPLQWGAAGSQTLYNAAIAPFTHEKVNWAVDGTLGLVANASFEQLDGAIEGYNLNPQTAFSEGITKSERTITPERLAHESKILAMIERLETHGLLDKDAIGLIYENSLKPAEKEAFDAARAERDAGDIDGNPSLLVQKLKELKDTLNISSNIGGHLSPLQTAFAGRRTTGVGAKLAADPTALTMAELEELGEQYSTLDPNLA
jgi:curved DNA-binding protein CbpA